MSVPHRYEVKVGLLVLAGMVAVMAMILMADKVDLERHWRAQAYLKDAAGLRHDSPVTLSGIAIGKVLSVRALPVQEAAGAPGPICAVLELPMGIDLPEDIQAKLSSSGLFGDAFLALAAAEKPSGRLMSKDGSGRVLVGPGFLEKAASRAEGLLSAADDLLSTDMRADAKRLVKNSADLAEHANAIAARLDAQGARIEAILTHLERTSTDIAAAAQRLPAVVERADRVLAGVESGVPPLLAKATAVAERLDATTAQAQQALQATAPQAEALVRDLAAAAESVRAVVQAVHTGQGLVGQLLLNRDLARDVHRIAIDASSAARTVADQPSRVVFDASAAERAEDRARRERELMRRSLAEGFPTEPLATPETTPPPTPRPALRPGEKPTERQP